MFRSIIFYSVFTFLMLTQSAFAQTAVSVRAGEHDGYSRVVFDWGVKPTYTVKKSADNLNINFENNVSSLSGISSSDTLRNISGFNIISKSPLSVSMKIPSDSRVRDFFAGSRLIIDVYNSPSGVKNKTKALSTAKKTTQASSKPKTVPKSAPIKKAKVVEATKKTAKQAIVADVEATPLAPVEKPSPAKINKNLINTPTVLSLSSTNIFGLAAFEVNNQIWIVSNKENMQLNPKITGPRAGDYSDIQPFKITGGQGFKMPIDDRSYLRGQGGGLLWRLVISYQEKVEHEHVAPKRKVLRGQVRGGKIIWPLKKPASVVETTHPISGETLKVVTVNDGTQFSGPAWEFSEFKTLPSLIGLVIVPKVDDLEIKVTDSGVEIGRVTQGLTLTSQDSVNAAKVSAVSRKEKSKNKKSQGPVIYDFKNWRLGDTTVLGKNLAVILSDIKNMDQGPQIENIITLAKMHLAHGLAPESLGFLSLAQTLLPGIESHPEFLALNGAAKALANKYEDSFEDLLSKDLDEYPEIKYWRTYALAGLEDWDQAGTAMPEDLSQLYKYPPILFNKIALVLAEVALRSGDVRNASELLAQVEINAESLWNSQAAALDYLKGESARQRGQVEQTREYWTPLTTGEDDLYRAKAGLALTRLDVNEGELNAVEAIDSLERLRYAWRGDQLEAQISYWLGRTYFEASEYDKGLNTMREAATYAAGTTLSRRIANEMSDVYIDLFLSDKISKVEPSDAIALYEQFSELIPSDERGNKMAENLAERLVEADLLERASNLLDYQLQYRVSGEDAYRVAQRLAVIQLLNNQPKQALRSISKATSLYNGLDAPLQTEEKALQLSLLRARALADQGQPDKAFKMLEGIQSHPDVNRLMADIAWNASYWGDAAYALNDVILDENISLTRPFDDGQSKLILNRAVALNLADDRVALANMREKYADAMAQTPQADLFEVITRPNQRSTLADRQTLVNIVSETDLFANFLDSYRSLKEE